MQGILCRHRTIKVEKELKVTILSNLLVRPSIQRDLASQMDQLDPENKTMHELVIELINLILRNIGNTYIKGKFFLLPR